MAALKCCAESRPQVMLQFKNWINYSFLLNALNIFSNLLTAMVGVPSARLLAFGIFIRSIPFRIVLLAPIWVVFSPSLIVVTILLFVSCGANTALLTITATANSAPMLKFSYRQF
jgi:hypothetical protein